jgi:hypothetical protein
MTFRRRRVEGLTTSASFTLGTVGGGPGTGGYATLRGISARNWASSAKAAAGTDAAGKLEVDDADGYVIFLDAADRDYKTAQVRLNTVTDDTRTGLEAITTFVDMTGAPLTFAANAFLPQPMVFKLPFTVKAINFGTVTDFLTVDLLLEV